MSTTSSSSYIEIDDEWSDDDDGTHLGGPERKWKGVRKSRETNRNKQWSPNQFVLAVNTFNWFDSERALSRVWIDDKWFQVDFVSTPRWSTYTAIVSDNSIVDYERKRENENPVCRDSILYIAVFRVVTHKWAWHWTSSNQIELKSKSAEPNFPGDMI